MSVSKVTDGIYLFSFTRHGDVGFVGNSVAILSDEGVLVFDAGCVPSDSAAVLGEIRKLTDKPVLYVVNSHWHWDHWQGNETYKAAFPGVVIISQERTRRLMREVSVPKTQNDLKDLGDYVASLEKSLATKQRGGASGSEIEDLKQLLNADRDFLIRKRAVKFTYPDVTYGDSATIWLGGREIRLMHAEAITSGDTFAYLPQDGVLITGDILVRPIPFSAGGTFPRDWIGTLQKLISLHPKIVIPGHGKPEGAKEALEQEIRLFQNVVQKVKEAKEAGLTEDEAVESIGKRDGELAALIGITDPDMISAMRPFFLDGFVGRAYEEMNHELSDLPTHRDR